MDSINGTKWSRSKSGCTNKTGTSIDRREQYNIHPDATLKVLSTHNEPGIDVMWAPCRVLQPIDWGPRSSSLGSSGLGYQNDEDTYIFGFRHCAEVHNLSGADNNTMRKVQAGDVVEVFQPILSCLDEEKVHHPKKGAMPDLGNSKISEAQHSREGPIVTISHAPSKPTVFLCTQYLVSSSCICIGI